MSDLIFFSSQNEKWATRWEDFNKWDAEHGFTLDPCAEHSTAKCNVYFTEEEDGLKQDWSGFKCFINPPYGAAHIMQWLDKAYDEYKNNGVGSFLLLPSRTGSAWFHEYCTKFDVQFLRGRLTFGSDDYWEWYRSQEVLPTGKKNGMYGKEKGMNNAPFDSVIFKIGL